MTATTKFFIFFIVSGLYLAPSQTDKFRPLPDKLVGIHINEYRRFLHHQPSQQPLDRLYCRGDHCFFLVNDSDIHRLRSAGIKVEEARFPTAAFRGPDRPQGDVNGRYHHYRETEALLFELAERFPDRASVFSIGRSIEGRELYVIKISAHVQTEEAEPNIFITGCHHAREWISVEVPLLFARHLLEHFNDNPQVRRAVEGSQIYILPIQNPDGLEYSIYRYRWWRKNRRYNGDFSWGVDTNRNYGFQWGYDDAGSSPNPAGETYRGSAPFSEPECSAIREFLLAHPPDATLSFHNFSQIIIFPWGYVEELTPDDAEMRDIARNMSELIYQVNGRIYEYGTGPELLYPTNGDMEDWVYATFGVPAFTVELPAIDRLSGGFFTSEEEIDLSFSDQLPALLYFVNHFIRPEDASSPPSPSPLLKREPLSAPDQ